MVLGRGESKRLIGREMVLGKGNLFCTYSYVANGTKGEGSAELSGKGKSVLAMREKKCSRSEHFW